MTQDPQAWNQQDETSGAIPSGQFYLRVAGTGIGAANPTNENVGVPSGQFYARPAGTNTGTGTGTGLPTQEKSSASKSQTDGQSTSKGKNNNLNKALLGGLLGATLGTLAAALANKRTAEGANHAAQGVGKAVKSVGEGVSHAAKGVGEAVKSVTEGVNHAVVGTVVDALKDTAESAKQSIASSKDQLGQTAGYVNPAGQPEAQTTYVLIPVEKERVIERTIIVEPTMPEATGEANFRSQGVADQMPGNEQTSQYNEQSSQFNEQSSQFNEQSSQFNDQTPDFLG